MKEELQSKLVEILSSIQTATGKASDFAMAQLPDIAQSYVVYGRVWSIIDLATALFCFWFGLMLYKKAVYVVEKKKWESETLIPASIVSGLCMLAGFIGTCLSAKNIALVWLAPKVWLLKEIAGMLK